MSTFDAAFNRTDVTHGYTWRLGLSFHQASSVFWIQVLDAHTYLPVINPFKNRYY